MLIGPNDIQRYIPQRPPFVLVDGLLEAHADRYVTVFEVKAGGYFVQEDFLSEYGLIENMAQSCAAGLAYASRGDRKPAEGWIAGLARLHLSDVPRVGDIVRTEVLLKQHYGRLYRLEATCFAQDKKLVSCEITVAGA